ncbi:hypothetical protein niasHS_012877 [Heterodera schachtii]|uniref:Uncharacterized protein n=1 Tax=Heterodera schachtii TaxID=97005 RepID=A0ABD2IUK6_HETSC
MHLFENLSSCLSLQDTCYKKCGNTQQQCDNACHRCLRSPECKDTSDCSLRGVMSAVAGIVTGKTFQERQKEACCNEKLSPCTDRQKTCYSICGTTKQQCDDAYTKCSGPHSTECKDMIADVGSSNGKMAFIEDMIFNAAQQGCQPKCKEVISQCTQKRDVCYGVCGAKQKNCNDALCTCLIDRTTFFNCGPTAQAFCIWVQEHEESTFKALQEKACKQQKKTFKQIPSDELDKPENGQMEKSVGVNSSDVPPNATTTALTAIPLT